MDRRYRLKKSSDFQRVRNTGKAYAHPLFVLIYAPNSSMLTHVGITAGRSIGNAIKRNRAKRRLRACVQPWLKRLNPGFDIILIARKPLLSVKYNRLCSALLNALQKNHILMEENHGSETSTYNI